MDKSNFWIILLFAFALFITQKSVTYAIQDQMYIRLFSSEHSEAVSENVTLICEISFAYAVPTATWMRDNVELGSERDGNWGVITRNISLVKGERTPLYRSNLLVINVQKTHSYTCMSTVGTSSVSATVNVRVGPAPTLELSQLPSIVQPPGRNVDLICKAVSREPATVAWLQQPGYQTILDREIETHESTTPGGRYAYNLTLKLHPVTRNASYTCSAENEFGTKAYTLFVQTVPVIFGGSCDVDLDCATKNSQCIEEQCDCPPRNPIYIESEKACFPGSRFSEKCSYTKQCEALDNMTFCSTRGHCKCVEDAVFSMDLKRCYIPVGEPHAGEVYAGLGGALGFITVANLIMYFIMKRSEDPNEAEEEAASSRAERRSNPSFSIGSEGPSHRESRSNSTRSNHSTIYRKQVRVEHQTITSLVLAQLHDQSLSPTAARTSLGSKSSFSKTPSSKRSSKSESSSYNLSILVFGN